MIKEFERPFLYSHPSIIEEKIKSASNNLFQSKIRLIILLLMHNIYYIQAFIKNEKLSKVVLEILIISPVILCLFFYQSEDKEEKEQKGLKEILGEIKQIIFATLDNIYRIIFLKELIYSLTAFVEIFLFYQIFKRINFILLCLFLGNVLFFYSSLDKKWPKFVFRCRMFIKEIIEGIICIIITLIPTFAKEKKK